MDDSMLGIGFSGRHRLLPRVARGLGLEIRPLSEHDVFGDPFSRSSAPLRGASSLERPSPVSACSSRPAASRNSTDRAQPAALEEVQHRVGRGGADTLLEVRRWKSGKSTRRSHSIEIVNGRSDCGSDGRTASKPFKRLEISETRDFERASSSGSVQVTSQP